MKFYKPFRPFFISQRWGVPNPVYAQFGFTQHNGLDVAALTPGNPPIQLKTWPIYCPVEGFRVQQVRWNPNGGGNEIWLISKKEKQVGDKMCYAQIIFMHNEKVLVPVGYEPALGELVAIGDNTGFSTGPHSHIGLYRVNKYYKKIDQNEANGSYDLEPFLQNEFAVDQSTVTTLLTSVMRYYKYKAGL